MLNGAGLQKILNKRGIKPQQLADAAGVSLQTVYNVLGGNYSTAATELLEALHRLCPDVPLDGYFAKRRHEIYKGGTK